MTLIRAFNDRRTQVVSIAGDSDWVAWVEGSLQPNFVDWALYSYDRRSGAIRALSSAPKPYQTTPPVMISMSKGMIVLSAVEAADGVFHVYAVNADGSGSRVIAANAKGPQIVWPWVLYDSISLGAAGTLVRLNLETSEVQPIAGPTDVSYFAYDGTSLAWISANTNHIFLQAPITASPAELYSGRYLEFVSISNRLVGWGQDKGTFVYDRKLRVIVQLSQLYDFYPVISGGALDWLYQPDPIANNPFEGTVWRQVNINDLP